MRTSTIKKKVTFSNTHLPSSPYTQVGRLRGGEFYPHLCSTCREVIDEVKQEFENGSIIDSEEEGDEAPARYALVNALYCNGRRCDSIQSFKKVTVKDGNDVLELFGNADSIFWVEDAIHIHVGDYDFQNSRVVEEYHEDVLPYVYDLIEGASNLDEAISIVESPDLGTWAVYKKIGTLSTLVLHRRYKKEVFLTKKGVKIGNHIFRKVK